MAAGWPYRGWVTLSGALASVLSVFVLVGPSVVGTTSWSEFGNLAGFLLMMAWIGGVAAFCCTLIFDGLSRVAVRARVAA